MKIRDIFNNGLWNFLQVFFMFAVCFPFVDGAGIALFVTAITLVLLVGAWWVWLGLLDYVEALEQYWEDTAGAAAAIREARREK